MEKWEQSLREDRLRRERKNPSFSSSLLDAIYRSIDEGGGEGEKEVILYRETMRKKQSNRINSNTKEAVEEEEMTSLKRACRVEKWMEKKVTEKVMLRRKAPDYEDIGFLKVQRDRTSMLLNSTSSSSESSSGGFSSSEAESVYGAKSEDFAPIRPKPVRTGPPVRHEKSDNCVRQQLPFWQQNKPQISEIKTSNHLPHQKSKQEGFVKSKSRASKIYGDLKKAKQPLSPGGRLASFLNSIFAAGNAKKAKISSSSPSIGDSCTERKSKSAQASTCSSASSYSRSCLSKTPSSRGKPVNGVKRSVRFYPVSVIVDEDCRPCGQKCLYEDDRDFPALTSVNRMEESPPFLNQELKFHLMEKNKRVEEAAKNLLKGYQKKSNLLGEVLRDLNQEDEEDDDDAASYSSSDLFELENLAAIGMERYREELPVYETTHLNTNRAIAKGLIL